jgi:hypothetical protein
MLPAEVVTEDARLEATAAGADEALARHRWHWTLDPSNGRRVALRQYAREVGRDIKTIHTHAHGYAAWIAQGDEASPITEDGVGQRTLGDQIERAGMSAEREAVVDAIAEAEGIAPSTVMRTRKPQVSRIREMARERAEDHGTTVEHEARKIADFSVKAQKARQRTTAERKAQVPLNVLELDATLTKAKRWLATALDQARALDWEENPDAADHQEILQDTLNGAKALLGLVALAIGGAADVDWDKELAALNEGDAR